MKRKILIIILLVILGILGIASLYPCLMQVGIIMTSDYMIMCTEEDKEYISKYWKGREDYTFAILDIEGFLHPSSKAKIIINSFPYPNVFGKEIIIEKNKDNVKGAIGEYIKDNSNKGNALLVVTFPFIILYAIIIIFIKKLSKAKDS